MTASLISGERWMAQYWLGAASEDAARAMAGDICVEQTVEFPQALLPPGFIADSVVGRLEALQPAPATPERPTPGFWATISYAIETVGDELPQLLNVLFGNVSLKPGVVVWDIRLPDSLLTTFAGPRFGCGGLRARLNVWDRPLVFTALKPMGLSARELADRAYQMALGGVDVIKDDHGLANQSFAPFEARVAACAEAVEKANRLTGARAAYVANITGPFDQMRARARFAQEAGAGGALICPALSGFDVMRALAADDAVTLALFAHPAFLGSFLLNPVAGIAHGALLGRIMRLAGADAVIYPNEGGRFSFTRAQCAAIASAAGDPMGAVKPIFPCPGGGMTLDRIPELVRAYGRDVMLLIGGDAFARGTDLAANCRDFRARVEACVTRADARSG